MGKTVQLNARMPQALKSSGDEALALIGLNPTQAVRALWEKASRRGKDLEEVAELLGVRADEPAGKSAPLDDAAALGWTIVDDVYASHGLTYEPAEPTLSDSDLLEIELSERYAERGLL